MVDMSGWREKCSLVNIAFAVLVVVSAADPSGTYLNLHNCQTSPRIFYEKIAYDSYDAGLTQPFSSHIQQRRFAGVAEASSEFRRHPIPIHSESGAETISGP